MRLMIKVCFFDFLQKVAVDIIKNSINENKKSNHQLFRAASRLRQYAYSCGSRDNISIIIIQF
jgi:serine/threonine protein phosphatase PrpC